MAARPQLQKALISQLSAAAAAAATAATAAGGEGGEEDAGADSTMDEFELMDSDDGSFGLPVTCSFALVEDKGADGEAAAEAAAAEEEAVA